MKKILFTWILASTFMLMGATTVSAAGLPIDPNFYPEGSPTITGARPTETGDDTEAARLALTFRVVNIILGIVGTVAIFFIVNNAWFMVAAGGSEEKITQHKKGLTWAVIGLVLIVLSYSIIRFIIEIPFQADEKTATAGASEASGGGAGNAAPAAAPAPEPDAPTPRSQFNETPDNSSLYDITN